jgi:hypothetical protein
MIGPNVSLRCKPVLRSRSLILAGIALAGVLGLGSNPLRAQDAQSLKIRISPSASKGRTPTRD